MFDYPLFSRAKKTRTHYANILLKLKELALFCLLAGRSKGLLPEHTRRLHPCAMPTVLFTTSRSVEIIDREALPSCSLAEEA